MIASLERCPISCVVNPSYHINACNTGVEYMINNPEIFIESGRDHSACMSQLAAGYME